MYHMRLVTHYRLGNCSLYHLRGLEGKKCSFASLNEDLGSLLAFFTFFVSAQQFFPKTFDVQGMLEDGVCW